MKLIATLAASLAVAALSIHAASAAEEDLAPWSSAQVCGAAAVVYYYLDAPAEHLGEQDGWHQLKSASGYQYACRVGDSGVEFRWKNMAGDPMEFDETQYAVDGDELRVEAEGVAKVFKLAGGAWTLLRCDAGCS